MRPTFVVIGAQRAGTTTLFERLRHHPDVFLPPIKELSFFVEERRWGLGVDWYEGQYADAGAVAHAGDVSPGYSMFPIFAGVPARMASVVPGAKLVYLVRDPIERMRSHYVLARMQGLERHPIDHALLTGFHYQAPSLYALQLEQFLEHYDRADVLVLQAEAMADRPQAELDRLLAFLDLEPGWTPPDLLAVHNASTGGRTARRPVTLAQGALGGVGAIRTADRLRKLAVDHPRLSRPLTTDEVTVSPALRAKLEAVVRPDVARLRELVGSGMDLWGMA